MAKVLLVTGGAGFIGANFVHYWLAKYSADRIVVLDALTYAGNLASLASVRSSARLRFVHGNILDQPLVEKLLREEKVSTLVHFAAESHVDRSISGPDAFIETNVMGTHSLLKAAKKVWVDEQRLLEPCRFHHVSTDEVYGSLGKSDPPFREDMAYKPNSPYSASKAASDHLVRAYHQTYGLPVTTSNCSNNYGPLHFPEKLIPLTIINVLLNKPLCLYGNGMQVRDWLYVEDHARGVDLVLQYGVTGETYNIGGCNERTNLDVVKLICRLVDNIFAVDTSMAVRFPTAKSAIGGNAESLIRFVKDRPGHDQRYAIDPQKAKTVLGYRPQESFESGIHKTLEWYLNNATWWRGVMDGSYKDWIKDQYQLESIS